MPAPVSLLALVQRLGREPDSRQRIKQLVQLSQGIKPLPIAERTPERRVLGCNAQVYVKALVTNHQVTIQGWSDALVVQGLLALFIRGLEGCEPQSILCTEPSFIQEAGLNLSLTPSRTNGFLLIFQKIQSQILRAYHDSTH